MTATFPRRRIFAGDDLLFIMDWRQGTPKAIGLPVDVTGFAFDATLSQAGKPVATALTTVDASAGRITVHIDENKTASLEGECELRVRYTDFRDLTRTLVSVPIEIAR